VQQQPREILQTYWGFSNFKGSQEKIIQQCLAGKDVLALLPTGGGKSICYQVPAMAKKGICLVISPLVALIQNQVDTLKKRNIKAIALTGGISFEELNNRLDNCIYGNYKFLYVSPERLQQVLVQERIRQMQVNLIAVDEAHCISQWGHDFRPAYLQCASIRTLVPEAPIMALTATATKKVTQDIMEHLAFTKPLVVKDSFARPNIAFSVQRTEDKLYHLKKLFKQGKESGIVYVRSRKKTVELANYLKGHNITAAPYHGGLTKNEKKERLDDWLNNAFRVMVATNAFGMGVDKPNVRTVVHYSLPESLENYYQEAGRGGRDGKPAAAVLLQNPEDTETAKKQFLNALPGLPFFKQLYKNLNNHLQIAYGEGSGVPYALHLNAFCDRYKMPPLKTYNALRLLDQNSVLSLSEAFNRKTVLHITATKAVLFGYLENLKAESKIVFVILRTYGGILDFETNINTYLIAKKSGVSEKKVLALLQKLHQDAIAVFNVGAQDLQLTFLVPREDEKTIYRIQRNITLLLENKTQHLDHMLQYSKNSKQCRSRMLLKYFDEQLPTDCGICDICQSGKLENLDVLQRSVSVALKSKPRTARSLVALFDSKEQALFAVLRRLLEEGTIVINAKNEYEHSN